MVGMAGTATNSLGPRLVLSQDLIGIGWDVRGWQSDKQATAVARLRKGTGELEWLGVSPPYSFSQGSCPGLSALIDPALKDAAPEFVISSPRVAIAIDAPLSFPRAFCDLIAGNSTSLPVPAREIDNRLAYRDCERWVAATFGKKPLSGPFDKLGNNASLVISISRQLETEGFKLVPQSAPSSEKALIEVYPALVKVGKKKSDPAVPGISRHLPEELESGSDQYDAAICAMLGLIYLGAGPYLDLPELVPFPALSDRQEGWIFTLPPDRIESEAEHSRDGTGYQAAPTTCSSS